MNLTENELTMIMMKDNYYTVNKAKIVVELSMSSYGE